MRTAVALIFVGGSIGMIRNKKTGRIEPIESPDELLRFVSQLQSEISLHFISFSNLGSSNVTPDHWQKLASWIYENESQYEGFIIIHGNNTMCFTASALSFALQGLSKPVILTGSVLPINELGSDGPTNVFYAARACTLDIAEVAIVCGTKVFRGNRTTRLGDIPFETFESHHIKPLATFGTNITLSEERMTRRKRTLTVATNFNTNVVTISLHPGIALSFLDAVLASKPDGIILRTYGTGMLPNYLMPWLEKLTQMQIPILLISQLPMGNIYLQHFASQVELETMGIISGGDMTSECATAKMMWALGQTNDLKRIKILLEKNLAGERST